MEPSEKKGCIDALTKELETLDFYADQLNLPVYQVDAEEDGAQEIFTIRVYSQNRNGLFKWICFLGFLCVCYFCYYAFFVNDFPLSDPQIYIGKVSVAALLYIILAFVLSRKTNSLIAREQKMFNNISNDFKLLFLKRTVLRKFESFERFDEIHKQLQDVRLVLKELTIDSLQTKQSIRDYHAKVITDKFFKLFYYALLAASIYMIYKLL